MVKFRGGVTKHPIWRCQVAASNAEMLERKKADAIERAAEDRRIAAYLLDKAAREQVVPKKSPVSMGFYEEQTTQVQKATAMCAFQCYA